jgi:succinate dehydrogenase / fumarate reductase iron-sulfur subunit
MRFSIYRFDPATDKKPYMQHYDVALEPSDKMLLDALVRIKDKDDTLAFRRSCREGVCGSDAMNINGRNGLACITKLSDLREPVEIRPLPSFPVIRDLVVDMEHFFDQYHSIRPYMLGREPPPAKEHLQSPEERGRLDGLYECILCACCTTFCPTYWWHPERFLGPAVLLQACRFLEDSRDTAAAERLEALDDVFKLHRCRAIMNCTNICPKGLNPALAISKIRHKIVKQSL